MEQEPEPAAREISEDEEEDQEPAVEEDKMDVDDAGSISNNDDEAVDNTLKTEEPPKEPNPLAEMRSSLTEEDYKRRRREAKKIRKRIRKDIKLQMRKAEDALKPPKPKPKPNTSKERNENPNTVLRSGQAVDLAEPESDAEVKGSASVEVDEKKGKKSKKNKQKGPTTSAHFPQPPAPKLTHKEREIKEAEALLPKSVQKIMAEASKAVAAAASVLEETVEKNAKAKTEKVEGQAGDSEKKKKKRKRDRNQNRLEDQEKPAATERSQPEEGSVLKDAKKVKDSKTTVSAEDSANAAESGEPATKKRRRDRGRKSEAKQEKDVEMVEATHATIPDANDSAPAEVDNNEMQASQPEAAALTISEPMSLDIDAETPSKKVKKSKRKRHTQEMQSQSQNPSDLAEGTGVEEPLHELPDTNSGKSKTRKRNRAKKHSKTEPDASQATEEGAKAIHS